MIHPKFNIDFKPLYRKLRFKKKKKKKVRMRMCYCITLLKWDWPINTVGFYCNKWHHLGCWQTRGFKAHQAKQILVMSNIESNISFHWMYNVLLPKDYYVLLIVLGLLRLTCWIFFFFFYLSSLMQTSFEDVNILDDASNEVNQDGSK